MAYNNSDVRVLGDMELSGALSFEKNYSEFPANPKPRTIVVKAGVTYIYTELVDGSGFWSWQPIGVKQASYLHTQGLASTTWTVNHGFNSNDFAYFVYDENHNLVFANIEIVDANTARIVLSSAMTGTAVFFSIEYVNAQNLHASTSVTIGSVELTAPSGQLLVGGEPVALVSDLGSLNTLATDANAYTDAAVATAITEAATDATAKVAVETSRATAAEADLDTRISSILTNTDATALNSLSELVAAFQAADSNLTTSISNLTTSAASALATEVTNRTAADATTLAEAATDATTKANAAQAAAIAASAPIAHVGAGGTAHATVVAAGAAGFMTGADKTKLDAVIGSNTGDETNDTIKTKLGITTLSGSNTGDQTTITGNAGTATKLATARTINGVDFDGTAAITINAVDSTARVASSLLGAVNGVATLDAAGLVPSTQLPSYVDDVLEFANLASLPTTGTTGKIYVALDTNKTYRWSGTAYVYITSGAVDSVAGKTGIVTLVKADVGLGNVDNTTDSAKPVSTAQQTALSLKANLASPAFTGVPTAATAAVSTNTTQIATTAFVNAEIANDAAPIAHVGTGGTSHAAVTTTVSGFMSASDKSKLDGIASGATSNTGTVTSVTGTAPIVSSGGVAPVISIAAATTSTAGSMSAEDKTKLNGLSSGGGLVTYPSAAGKTWMKLIVPFDSNGNVALQHKYFALATDGSVYYCQPSQDNGWQAFTVAAQTGTAILPTGKTWLDFTVPFDDTGNVAIQPKYFALATDGSVYYCQPSQNNGWRAFTVAAQFGTAILP